MFDTIATSNQSVHAYLQSYFVDEFPLIALYLMLINYTFVEVVLLLHYISIFNQFISYIIPWSHLFPFIRFADMSRAIYVA